MGKDGLKSLTEMLKKDEVIIQNHNNLVEIFKNSIQESQHLSKDVEKSHNGNRERQIQYNP